MTFELSALEPADVAVRRIATELVDGALAGLTGDGDPDVAVHEARKACKRLRALLRLVRPELSKAQFRDENVRIRDAARLLSGARDRAVLRKTFARLVAAANDPAVFEDLRPAFAGVEPDMAPDSEAIADAVVALRDARGAVQAWTLRDRGWKTFAKGLAKIYEDGAAAMAEAEGQPDDEVWHDWRKQAKYLWHALELLQPTWPRVAEALAAEAHALSDALGDEHDLQVLRDALHAAPGGEPLPPALMALLSARRAELHTTALSVGRRLYADDPKVFTDRLKRWYVAWEDDARRGAVGAHPS